MDTMILKKVRTVVSVHVLALSSMAAWAQDYPWKAITLVVGYPAGGSVDLVARAIAPGLSRRLGQPVNVENIPGTSGALAAARVALAEPDGHTLLLGSPAEVGINHLVSRRRDGYNPLKDSTPIGLIGSQPLVLVAGRKTPVASVDEFLRATAEAPAPMRYASSGMGTPLHLAGETIRQQSGVRMVHVPSRGAGAMLANLDSGDVDFAVMVLSSALPHIKDGKVKAIGVTKLERSAAAPQIPALAENARFKGVDAGVWFGLLGPGKLPPATTTRLREGLQQLLKEPELRKTLEAAGLTMMEGTDFVPFLQAEIQKFRRVVEFANIRN